MVPLDTSKILIFGGSTCRIFEKQSDGVLFDTQGMKIVKTFKVQKVFHFKQNSHCVVRSGEIYAIAQDEWKISKLIELPRGCSENDTIEPRTIMTIED